MRPVRYLPGPSLPGFWGIFEADFGDPSTPRPYCRVVPSVVGSAVLPFRCPRCGAAVDLSDRRRWGWYRDPRPGRANHWCPRCGYRFYLSERGRPLDGPVDEVGCAPALVERLVRRLDGGTDVERREQRGRRSGWWGRRSASRSRAEAEYLLGIALLGCC